MSGFKGFSFTKKVEERQNLGAQLKENDDKIEAIGTFDKDTLKKEVNLPTVDFGLDLATLKEKDAAAKNAENAKSSGASRVQQESGSGGTPGGRYDDFQHNPILDQEDGGGLVLPAAAPVDATTSVEDREAIAALMSEARGETPPPSATPSTNGAAPAMSAPPQPSEGPQYGLVPGATKAGDNAKKADEIVAGSADDLFRPQKRVNSGEKPILSRAKPAVSADASLDQFEQISVENFGMAYLRGLGYDENIHYQKMSEVKAAKKGLGLGATSLADVILPHEKEAAKKSSDAAGSSAAPPKSDRPKNPPLTTSSVLPAQGTSPDRIERRGGRGSTSSGGRRSNRSRSPRRHSSKTWLRKGLIVKICDDRHEYYAKKGEIRSVDTSAKKPVCSIRIVSSKTGDFVADVGNLAEKHLQTTSGGTSTVLLRDLDGDVWREHGDEVVVEVVDGTLNKDKNTVRVVLPDGERAKVSLDHICCASKRAGGR